MSALTPERLSIQVSDKLGALEVRLRYRVRCTAHPATDSHITVLAALAAGGTDVYKGAALSSDATCFCTEVSPSITDRDVHRDSATGANQWWWTADAVFTTKPKDDPADLSQPNPTLRRPKIRIEQLDYTGPVKTDITPTVVKNSAGDPVRRQRPFAKTLIVIDKFFSAYDLAKTNIATPTGGGGYRYSRNTATWNPFGPYATLYGSHTVGAGLGLITKLTVGEIDWEKNVAYLPVHLEVLEDPVDAHADAFIDEGFRCLAPGASPGTALIQVSDPQTGRYTSTPWPLDGNGHQQVLGGSVITLGRQYFPLKDWATGGTPAGLGF